MDNIKVSICVVTYNQENYIRQCLQSLVNQQASFKFEVIVSDDCSTDTTPIIIAEFQEKYPNLIKPILHKENMGAFENFLFAHNQASGIYVCHLDGDDFWLPGKLSYQAKILDDNPDCVQCWTCAYLVDDKGEKVGLFPSKIARIFYPTKIMSKDIALSYALVGHHSTQMYRRSARKNNLLLGEFLDYWVAFTNSTSGKSIYSKEVLSAYRLGSIDSLTRNKSNKKVAVDLLSKHLKTIIYEYPEYAEYAKANLIVRKLMSRLKGHDLTIIEKEIKEVSYIKNNYFLIIKSLTYFLLQKIN